MPSFAFQAESARMAWADDGHREAPKEATSGYVLLASDGAFTATGDFVVNRLTW